MADPLSVREKIVNGEIRVVSPWDGKEIVRIPTTPPENIPEVVEKVRLAQERWRRVPLRERGKILRKILKPFYRRAEELVDRLYLEVGRHRAESWFQEIVPNLDLVRYWSGPGARFLHDEKVFLNPVSYPGKKAYVTLLPRGVVGVITPLELSCFYPSPEYHPCSPFWQWGCVETERVFCLGFGTSLRNFSGSLTFPGDFDGGSGGTPGWGSSSSGSRWNQFYREPEGGRRGCTASGGANDSCKS
jgi:hypothetical protein